MKWKDLPLSVLERKLEGKQKFLRLLNCYYRIGVDFSGQSTAKRMSRIRSNIFLIKDIIRSRKVSHDQDT